MIIDLGESALDVALRNNQGSVALLFLTKSSYQNKDVPFHLFSDKKKGNF